MIPYFFLIYKKLKIKNKTKNIFLIFFEVRDELGHSEFENHEVVSKIPSQTWDQQGQGIIVKW